MFLIIKDGFYTRKEITMEKYLNTNLSAEERASDLLSKMSLEERMAQVNCVLLPGGRRITSLNTVSTA